MVSTLSRSLFVLLAALLLVPVVIADEGEEKEGDDAKAPVIELVSNGAEPRQELRYSPTKGTKLDIEMKMGIEIDSAMGAMALPTVVINGSFEVLATEDNGDFTIKTSFSEIGTEGEDTTGMGAMILGSLDSMKGLTVTTKQDCSGKMIDTVVSEEEFADPMQKQMFDSLMRMAEMQVTGLPSEALGVGAKWKQKNDVETGGMKIKQVATYEVTKIEKSKVTLKVSVEQTADKQTVQHPMGFPMELVDLKGGGSGITVLDLSTGAADSADLAMSTAMKVEVDLGMEEPTVQEQGTRVKMTSTAKPAKAVTTAPSEGEGEK